MGTADSTPDPSPLQNPRTKQLIFFALLAGLVFAVYASSIDGPFIFDDSRIENNPPLHITELSAAGLIKAGFASSPKTRPLSYMSFALNYYFHGFNTRGYHLVNIAIHLLTAYFLYLFISTTLNLPPLQSRYGKAKWLPFAAALIWALHPLQTQSVTYIIQRMNSMAAMFYILALYLYAQGRLTENNRSKLLLFTGTALAGIFALGSKEIAVTLPLFIFLYEWFFFRDLSTGWLKKQIIPAAIMLAVIVFLALLYLGLNPVDRIMASYASRDFNLSQRLLTEFRVVVFYISLILFPHPSRLNLDHHIVFSSGLFSPLSTCIAAAVIVLLFVTALVTARKERLISFCILWFLGNLVVESSVIGLELIFEHRNYLPSMLFVLLLVVLFRSMVKQPWLRIGSLCIILVLLSFWTFERNRVWADRISLWGDSAAKSPAKARPHNNLAVALKADGQLEKAIFHFKQTVELDPQFFEAYYNLGNAYVTLGRDKEAILYFKKALEHVPENPMLHANLANALFNTWQLAAARYHYSEALRLNPGDMNARINLANVEQMLRAQKSRQQKLP